jgi:hypothetical protein
MTLIPLTNWTFEEEKTVKLSMRSAFNIYTISLGFRFVGTELVSGSHYRIDGHFIKYRHSDKNALCGSATVPFRRFISSLFGGC